MTTARPQSSGPLNHRLRRMTARDPDQVHRGATPLELLFDLTFVVAFGQAADQLAHYLAEGHVLSALSGFVLSMLAVCWAWIGFSWMASGYDTDDWFFRIMTMVQMVGVLVLALGIPAFFVSIDEGEPLESGIMVAGYVVMRVAVVAQWVRAAWQDVAHRAANIANAAVVLVSSLAWVMFYLLRTMPSSIVALVLVVAVVTDFGGPFFVDRRFGGKGWHAAHIAERHGLLVIIALGEAIFGTIASVSAIVQHDAWTSEAVLIVVAGTGLTFGLWWSYFTLPSAQVLAVHRSRAALWGYAHILVFTSIAAVGAGLHVAAYVIEGHARISAVGAVASVAVPVLVFLLVVFALNAFLVRALDPFHLVLLAGMVITLALSLIVVGAGASIGTGLMIVMVAPLVGVVGYETVGSRHEEQVLARLN